MRKSGVFLPIFSLPSPYGIGDFSKSAYAFVDFLKESRQAFWQILPLGPTGYGNSPYQSFSAFAGNHYMISPTLLMEEGLLTPSECAASSFGQDRSKVDYAALYAHRLPLLKKAFARNAAEGTRAFRAFCHENADWLEDFCLFMAVKSHFGGAPWLDWPRDIRERQPLSVEAYRQKLAPEIRFWRWTQFVFFTQWMRLRAYMRKNRVSVIGDLPLYVSMDSSDTWANPSLFQFGADGVPLQVAGCPPDDFAPMGQLWGNPLYNWPNHKKSGYAWWTRRIRHSFRLYDTIRIDHFRGLSSYYAIPHGNADAAGGRWENGPGHDFLESVTSQFDRTKFIAEDLGFITPPVKVLLQKAGFMGMQVFPFSFSASPRLLPSSYPVQCVAYPSTHDTMPLAAWLLEDADRNAAVKKALQASNVPDDSLYQAVLSALLKSPASLCILPMQDLLGLPSARINIPGTPSGNWEWRLESEEGFRRALPLLSALTKQSRRI